VEKRMTEEQKTEVGKQKTEYRTLDKEQTDLSQQEQDIETTVETVVEAVLFASDEPLSESRLAGIVETGSKQVRQCIENLNGKYKANNNAFRIEQIAGGYQMLTLSPYNYWLKKLLRARSDSKLSPAAVERQQTKPRRGGDPCHNFIQAAGHAG
jgi:segregation and condensation protein B